MRSCYAYYLYLVISLMVSNSGFADRGTWSLPQNVSIKGSASYSTVDGSVSYSINMSGSDMQAGTLSSNGGSIGGKASGTYSVTITTNDGNGNCSDSGSIDNNFSVSFGGADPWSGYFTFSQSKSSSDYKCQLGPLDVLHALHGTIYGCGGTVPDGRPLADQDDPQLTIDQTETGSCGSINEHAYIFNEQMDDDAAPISSGAQLDSASLQSSINWSSVSNHSIKVGVKVKSEGSIKVTIRSGAIKLGSKQLTAKKAGTVTVLVPLNVKAVNKVLLSKKTVSLNAFIAGSNVGIVKSTKLKK